MKKFINKFKKLDLTKKLVIIFITISFVFILGITTYNALTDNFENNETVTITNTNKKDNNRNKLRDNDNKSDEELENNEENNETENNELEEKEQENNENVKENNNTNKKNSSSQKEEQNNTSTNSANENNNSSASNNQTNSNNTASTPVTESISVNVQVIGMGSTMMSGTLTVEKGANAYSVLKELASKRGVKITTSGFGSMVYVRGIGDLMEKQHGNLSGWMYRVNGNSPNIGAGNYTLNNGDSVVWYYVNYE